VVDQIKEEKWASNIYGTQEKYIDVLVGKPERDHLEYVGGNGKIILKWLLNMMGQQELDSSGL
jgi:hypothetical protein